jgi:hypothetical protein
MLLHYTALPPPVILEQNHIATAIISFGNPENMNVFWRAGRCPAPTVEIGGLCAKQRFIGCVIAVGENTNLIKFGMKGKIYEIFAFCAAAFCG